MTFLGGHSCPERHSPPLPPARPSRRNPDALRGLSVPAGAADASQEGYGRQRGRPRRTESTVEGSCLLRRAANSSRRDPDQPTAATHPGSVPASRLETPSRDGPPAFHATPIERPARSVSSPGPTLTCDPESGSLGPGPQASSRPALREALRLLLPLPHPGRGSPAGSDRSSSV